MIVMMVIDAERARGLRAEQAHILRMLRHRLRHARAADVAVEADDAVARRHHDVQIVRDEQHAEAAYVAQAPDERVELGLADVVDAAHRLVEHEQRRTSEQRPRQHDALQLAARELAQLLAPDVRRPDLAENDRRCAPSDASLPSARNRSTVIGSARSMSKRCGT